MLRKLYQRLLNIVLVVGPLHRKITLCFVREPRSFIDLHTTLVRQLLVTGTQIMSLSFLFAFAFAFAVALGLGDFFERFHICLINYP